jgi:hypothetical protein
VGEVGVSGIIIVSCLVYRGGMGFGVIVGVIIMNTICLVYLIVVILFMQLILVPFAIILYACFPPNSPSALTHAATAHYP